MGWVLMSERELNRVEVLSQVARGRMTAAANVLIKARESVVFPPPLPGHRGDHHEVVVGHLGIPHKNSEASQIDCRVGIPTNCGRQALRMPRETASTVRNALTVTQ